MEGKTPNIIVAGAGFGGLTFCKSFDRPDVHVVLIDRQNHHLFQPLLYQVATAGLSAPEIAQPIRSILSDRPNVTVLLDALQDLDLGRREIVLNRTRLSYDYLILALGGMTSYYGHPEWEQHAPGLKSLADALTIRKRVLLAFEKAETEPDPVERDRLLTIVVVGGGPTGVELAGAFAELARHVLARDFRRIDPRKAKVILIEASHIILNHLPASLANSAQQQLQRLGVEVRTSTRVNSITKNTVELNDGNIIRAETILWAAGVAASPITKRLGVELDRAGRVKVLPDLSVPGHREVFVIGDMAFVQQENGDPVPGVSPAAMQMAKHVSRIIEDELTFGPNPLVPRPSFKYWDKGTMATIGRSAAVAKIGPVEMTGLAAWVAWLFVHLIFLVGFRSKLVVLIQWAYSYCTYKRGARVVADAEES